MASLFTMAQRDAARRVNLYAWLLTHYPAEHRREGNELRATGINHHITIKRDANYYRDWATNEAGNPIDYLTRHLGYSVADAVLALTDGTVSAAPIPTQQEEKHRELVIPPHGPDNKRVWAYLTKTRGLSPDTVRLLLRCGTLYQDCGILYQDNRGNAVFINEQQDWGEVRGTASHSHYHRMLAGSRQDGFWYFLPDCLHISPVYICEGVIDALSLYELRRQQGNADGVYVSIGGAGKQAAIDRLARGGKRRLIIATDADEAGDATRKRNPSLETIRPEGTGIKDWNDMLLVKK